MNRFDARQFGRDVAVAAVRIWLRMEAATDAALIAARRHPPWAFCTVTGTIGLILLALLFLRGSKIGAPRPVPVVEKFTATSVTPRTVAPARVAMAPSRNASHDWNELVSTRLSRRAPIHELTTEAYRIEFLPSVPGRSFAAVASRSEPTPMPTLAARDPFFEEPPPRAIAAQPSPLAPPDLSLQVERKSPPRRAAAVPFDERFFVTSRTGPSEAVGDIVPVTRLESEGWRTSDLARHGGVGQPVAYPATRPAAAGDLTPAAAVDESDGATESPTPRATGELNVVVERRFDAAHPVHRRTRYEIVVRNAGADPVAAAEIEEPIPAWHLVADVAPAGTLDGRTLRWTLHDLAAGEERRIQVELIPTDPATGDVETVTSIRPTAAVGTTTRIVAPRLAFDVTAPASAVVGETVAVRFRVTNAGPVAIDELTVRHDLPDGLHSPLGRAIDYTVGTLGPGETREAQLDVRAAQPGGAIVRAAAVRGGIALQSRERAIVVASRTVTAPLAARSEPTRSPPPIAPPAVSPSPRPAPTRTPIARAPESRVAAPAPASQNASPQQRPAPVSPRPSASPSRPSRPANDCECVPYFAPW